MSKLAAMEMPPAMILCGGQGTRIRDVTEALPKPMVPIGSRPIVWHIMKTYASFGVNRFILCLGYKRESFADFFLNYHSRTSDVTIRLQSPEKTVYHGSSVSENWEVTLVDTGEETMTGGRVARAAKYLRDSDERCFLTYGDGVANIDIRRLYSFHLMHRLALTITAVHPTSRFGELDIDKGRVTSFTEKPPADQGMINGGFMVFERHFLTRYLNTETTTVLEQEPMRGAVEDGQVSAYVHDGFWQCMDTLREYRLLNKMWDEGTAPWKENWECSKKLTLFDASSSRDTTGSKVRGSRTGYAA